MKNERKPKTPIIAAHPAKKNGEKPAPPDGKNNGKKARARRVPKIGDAMDVSSLPEQNPNPVMRFTRDGEPLYANPAASSLLDFSIEKEVPPAWRETIRSSSERSANTELEIEHAGNIFSALFVPVQEFDYVNVYCLDISGQKQARKSLSTSEERLRLATRAAGLCTWEMDILNQTYTLGDNFEDVVGFSKESLPKNPNEVTDKINVAEDMQAVREVLIECVNNHRTDIPPLQYRLRHPETGQMIWVEVNAKLVYDEDGKPQSMSGMLQNITERKRLEELMRAKEAELQEVIDQTPFMLTRCTRDLRYRFVSRAYAEMLGRKPEEVAGKLILEILGEEGWNSIALHIEKVLTGERVEYESEISFKDVGVRSLHIIYTPDRDEQGDVIGWFASITDVSTRKAAEQERNHALQREQWQREIAERAWVVAEEARFRAEQELSERKRAETALGTWADAPLPQETHPVWQRYGMALVATAIVIALRGLLDPLLGTSVQYSLLLGAIAFSVWYGGVGPALLSLLVGYVGITWFILDWQILLAPTVITVTSLGIFIVSGVIVMLLGETMRRAQRHAHQSAGVAVTMQREGDLRLIEQQRTEQALRASEQRFREIFELAGVSVWVEDFSKVKMVIDDLRTQGITDFRAYLIANPDFVRRAIGMVDILDVNQETLDLYSASSKDQLLGSLNAIFTPETESAFLEELVALAEGREMVRSETQTQTLDGRPISILFNVHFNPLYGDYSRVIVTITDITERKRNERSIIEYARQQAALFKLAERLQHSYAPPKIYEAALDAILSALHCDRASILLFDETQRMRFVAWRGLSDAYRQATDGHSPWTIDEANPQMIFVDAIETADFSDELKTVIKDEGISSLAFIPLVPNGKLIGKFMVYFDAPHEFSEAELDLSQTIARQLAFDIARKRAEEQLRRSAELDAFRVSLADRLRPLREPAQIRAEGMCLLGEHLHVDRVFFAEVDDLAQVSMIIDNCVREGVPPLVGRNAVSEHGKAREILQTGRTLILPDIAASSMLGEEDKSLFANQGVASMMAVPIIRDGRWIANLGVSHGTARTWSERETTLLEDTAERAWASIERARSQQDLRASEALYRTIARGIPGGGVYVVDRNMRYLVAEGPVTESFGLAREMLEGHTVRDVFTDERGDRMEDRLRRTFSGETIDFETAHNGHVFWTQMAPLYDSIGQAIILTLDITERKHAEEELRKSREVAEQTTDRIAKLQEITAALAGSLSLEQLTDLILEQGTRASGAAAGILVEVVNGGKELRTVAALGYPPAAVRYEPVPISNRTPMSDAIQTKQAIWLGSHEEFAAQYPELAGLRGGFGNEAMVALPLIVGDRVVGGLAFSFAKKRDFLVEERGFLLALALQSAQGLERVRAAEALRESEQRFAGFMQHLPGLAWIKDIQGRYVFANDAAEKAFRVPQAELYGRTDEEAFPSNVADQFRRNDEQALREARGIQVVEELEHEDGILHYSLVNKFPILGSDGAVTLIGGMAIDITERRQAEERLVLLAQISELTRDSEDANELMSAVANVVEKHLHVKRCLFNEIDVENDVEVIHHDYHDGVESVSGVHRVTEYSSITSTEMLEGTTVVNNDSKTDPRTAKEYERSYLPNGERSYVAVPLMRDGRWAASLWVSDDKPRAWSDEDVALLQSIAERTWTACEKLRIHGELRDSEERLRVTFNTTAVGFAMLTPDTHFVDVNQAFCEIVGYSHDELSTMNFDYLIHPDYIKSTRDHIRRLLTGKIPSAIIEKLYIRKDGSQVWVQNNMSLVRDVDGDPLHLIVISQDVTERKQIEVLQQSVTESLLAAAEANAKFRTFFDQGSYFAGVMSLDGTLIEANRMYLEFCGFKREEVIGSKFWDCGWWNPSAELMELVRAGMQRALNGETFQQETSYYVADGSVRYMDLIIAPIKDADGRVLFLAPTGTDITERKHSEEELRQLNLLLEERVEKRTLQLKTSDELRRLETAERRQAQDRFVKSFNASPAAMSITRFEDGMYRNVNPKFIELLEYELGEVIGHTTLDLKIYKDPQERVELLKSIRGNNGKWDYETQLSTKSGRPLDINISVVEIELEGEPHILSMIVDITERNQILAALRASEGQLRTLFDVLPVGVAYVSQDRKVMEPNRTLEKILDISREELLSGAHQSRQYIRPDGSPMPDSEFASTRALREQRTINNVETGIVREGGQVIWTSVTATPISMPDPGVVVITVDVTERKHMDDELRRSHRRYQLLSQRLVEIQEEERRTISRELHDRVGQSLAALNLNLNFLNNGLSGTSSLQIKARLKDAIQLTEETVSTIRDVMADLRPPALDDYGLDAALNAYTDIFSRRFGIRVVLAKPVIPLPRFNPNIELTLLRIAQEALTNVARHANATHATVTLAAQNNMVYLTIEDNGEGIRSWQKANRPGSHGLKIMRERADTFGGTLQVHSFNKQGTKIEVKIPMQGNDQSTVRAEAD